LLKVNQSAIWTVIEKNLTDFAAYTTAKSKKPTRDSNIFFWATGNHDDSNQ